MIKRFTLFTILFLINFIAFAQDDVKYRVILFGDAGEMNAAQIQDLKNAAKQILPQKTTVLYLGDNIYPKGFPGDKHAEDKALAETKLTNQLKLTKQAARLKFSRTSALHNQPEQMYKIYTMK